MISRMFTLTDDFLTRYQRDPINVDIRKPLRHPEVQLCVSDAVCVRACVRVCLRACVRVCVGVGVF